MTGDLFQGGLLEAPLYPLKPGVSRGPPGLSGGPGPLRPLRNSTTADKRRTLLLSIQESHAVAGKPRDAAVNSDRYEVCWHFAGTISAWVLGQFSAQYKSDLHVLLST